MNRNVRFWLLLVGAIVLVVLLVGGAGTDGPAYDPRSANPDGARGIVETLERLGVDVDTNSSVPGDQATTALMLQSRLSPEDQDALARWVDEGGVLIVADPANPLAADRLGLTQFSTESIARGVCTIDALADVSLLQIQGRLFDVGTNQSCFGDNSRAFVVAEAFGAGTVVSVGSPDIFTNARLAEADAAGLALALLAPARSGSTVNFIGPSLVGFGEETLNDLIAPRVRNAIIQLLAAFLFYALYRSRRLGGVVAEPLPVHIEGSELVLKAGLLSERAKDPASAGRVLQQDVIRRARSALSVPPADDDRMLADRIASRTDLDPELVLAALTAPVTTETDLITTTQALSEIDDLLYSATSSEGATS